MKSIGCDSLIFRFLNRDKKEIEQCLERTLLQGFAVNNQELALGYASVAAAIFTGNGRLAAAISLTGPPDAVLGSEKEDIVHQVRNTAGEISRYMGHFPAAAATARSQYRRSG